MTEPCSTELCSTDPGSTDPARTEALVERLDSVLGGLRPAAVALSGGVDSMTLAFFAHRALGDDVTMFHAVSAAVPVAATERVETHAARHGWRLRLVDAGELADERYLANPANRCFFCKTDLYGTLAAHTDARLLSGTNTDDLADWRPGLRAADDHRVRHPFVEAGWAKADVRAAAAAHGLDDVADLPAAPCLSSRIETGLRIVPRTLRAVDEAETLLRAELAAEPAATTVRCRVRDAGVVVELDDVSLAALPPERRTVLAQRVEALFGGGRPVTFEAYARGSAFLRERSA